MWYTRVVGELGLGEMGLGEMGLGELGLGEMGGHPLYIDRSYSQWQELMFFL